MQRLFRSLVTRKLMTVSALSLACCGCGGPPSVSTSSDEAKISGSVTVFGKKATSGQVIIDPSNYKRPDAAPRVAKINADGTYETQTLVGDNFLRVEHPSLAKSREDMPTLQVNVANGGTKYDIVLPPQN
jgi:hypothetical protein